jgi:hypothetical protein
MLLGLRVLGQATITGTEQCQDQHGLSLPIAIEAAADDVSGLSPRWYRHLVRAPRQCATDAHLMAVAVELSDRPGRDVQPRLAAAAGSLRNIAPG